MKTLRNYISQGCVVECACNPARGRLIQEECCEFEASQDYTARSCYEQKNPKDLRIIGITRSEEKMAILELGLRFSIKVSNLCFH